MYNTLMFSIVIETQRFHALFKISYELFKKKAPQMVLLSTLNFSKQ